jgi:hypothetical protein
MPSSEQAHREAIARQEGEDLLFDTPHMTEEAADMEMEDFEEGCSPVVAARAQMEGHETIKDSQIKAGEARKIQSTTGQFSLGAAACRPAARLYPAGHDRPR